MLGCPNHCGTPLWLNRGASGNQDIAHRRLWPRAINFLFCYDIKWFTVDFVSPKAWFSACLQMLRIFLTMGDHFYSTLGGTIDRGAEVERRRRENRGAERGGVWGMGFLSPLGRGQYSPENFSISDLKMWWVLMHSVWFLRASAMLKHVIDIGWTSVCPSVCLSVTRWHPIKTAEYIVMLSSPHDSPCILVFLCRKLFAKFRRGHPLRGR